MSNDKALFCKVNKPEDVESDSPVAKKHVPGITAPSVFKVET